VGVQILVNKRTKQNGQKDFPASSHLKSSPKSML